MFVQRRPRSLAEGFVVENGSGSADDPQMPGQQPVGIEAVERWDQHPASEIARRTE